ncbi:hypothetical protein LPJ59_002295 [Coemansia sp. RSA 2399]|nr:hypothetical protein LPJ59_002295 [Coemansia sp. RSA 2399]KAJ1905690.1 hypothetical protein LPJ81_001785 [Coemansia sp. IMI 209127]
MYSNNEYVCTLLDTAVATYSVATLARADPRKLSTKHVLLATAIFAAHLLLTMRVFSVFSVFTELAFCTTIALGSANRALTIAAHLALCMRTVLAIPSDVVCAGANIFAHLASAILLE